MPIPSPTDATDGLSLDCGCKIGLGQDLADRAEAAPLAGLLTNAAPAVVGSAFPGALEVQFAGGERPRVPIVLRPQESVRVGLRVTVPASAKRGTTFTVDLLQREGDRIVGGVALTVNET